MVKDRRGGLLIRERKIDSWVLMNIEGVLFVRSIPAFLDSVKGWIDRDVCNFLLIFEINSKLGEEGMEAILRVFEEIRKCKGRLILVDVDEHLNRLKLSGLGKFFSIVSSEAEGFKLTGLGPATNA